MTLFLMPRAFTQQPLVGVISAWVSYIPQENYANESS
jgi:hypothetical protein